MKRMMNYQRSRRRHRGVQREIAQPASIGDGRRSGLTEARFFIAAMKVRNGEELRGEQDKNRGKSPAACSFTRSQPHRTSLNVQPGIARLYPAV